MAWRTETLAILFADIRTKTDLYDVLGDAAAFRTLGKCLASLSEVIETNDGRVIKTIGEQIMSTFSSPDLAIAAAADMQKRLAGLRQDNVVPRLSIGLHYGPAILKEGDVFGDSVNTAAKLVKLTNPGQILTTRATIDVLSGEWLSKTRSVGKFTVKGKQERMTVFEVLWQEAKNPVDLTVSPDGIFALEMPRTYVVLSCCGKEIFLDEPGRVISFGRDACNDLSIEDRLASRKHARVEYSSGKFLLIDQSTNGTFVRMDGGEIIWLRREKLILQGSGHISLGRKFTDEPVVMIHFRCTAPEGP